MEMNLSRHISVFNPEKVEHPIHIIGVGATGSFVAMEFARMGVKELYIYDFDGVEIHNIPNQYYDTEDLDKPKVEALTNKLKKINPEIKINIFNGMVYPEPKEGIEGKYISDMSGYVFLLVDSMKTRKELFEAVIKNRKQFIQCWESRLGSDQARVYCLPIEDNFNYNDYLTKHFYDDADAEVSACGTSITVLPIVMATASLMISQFIKIVMEDKNEPYIKHFSLFDNMYNLYTENFNEKKEEVKSVTVANGDIIF